MLLNPKDRILTTARLRFDWPATERGNGEANVFDRESGARLGAVKYTQMSRYTPKGESTWGLLARSAANEYGGTPRRGEYRRVMLCESVSQAESWLLAEWA
ncbi:hypothetical protein OG625_40220 (plasmid) [Streptomyces sp. NBC_01351]|uniref:hypothetical protein n=1 Tax=Streptomyces sp. NBC_01351 TaxID=2903833 RepID=UPI002E34A100|nr:hypothetical protein [Streptomyces sp. NBC_01351]